MYLSPAHAGMTTHRRGVLDERVDEHLRAGFGAAELRPDPHLDRQSGAHSLLVLRRDQEARDDQLPHLQAGAGRVVLRPHLRPDQGLRVLVRQVQADEISRHHLREMRRRGHAVKGAARPHGSYRAGLARCAYLVPEVAAEPHRPLARHDAEGPRADPVLRELRRHRARLDPAEATPAARRRRADEGAGRIRRRPVHRLDRRRGAAHDAVGDRPRRGETAAARRTARHRLRGAPQEARQAAEADRGVHGIEQPAGMDDPRSRAGHPARAAPAGAVGRRPLRDLGPQRPLPPRHQPQQPAEAPYRAARARHHRAQRKTHAAGGGGRAVRQRQARPGHHRRQQAAAEIAVRHAEGQAGPLPPEPVGQARRLFRAFGDRRRPRAEAAPVRAAEEDGARTVQAVHLLEARTLRAGEHDQGRQAHGREGTARGVGHPRRGDPRAPGLA